MLICWSSSKYLEKIGLDDTGDLKFFFNSKELSLFDGKSLEENQIYDNAIIQVKGNKTTNSETLHIIFVIKGRKYFIEGQSTDKFCDLAQKCINKAGIQPEDELKFNYLSSLIDKNDQRTIKELKLHNQSRIDVFLAHEIIKAGY